MACLCVRRALVALEAFRHTAINRHRSHVGSHRAARRCRVLRTCVRRAPGDLGGCVVQPAIKSQQFEVKKLITQIKKRKLKMYG